MLLVKRREILTVITRIMTIGWKVLRGIVLRGEPIMSDTSTQGHPHLTQRIDSGS
jgi:hypothetical protein